MLETTGDFDSDAAFHSYVFARQHHAAVLMDEVAARAVDDAIREVIPGHLDRGPAALVVLAIALAIFGFTCWVVT